jgi:ribonuclease HI
MNELYVDGGVIRKNPSTIGGTWAARVLADGVVIVDQSGVITPDEAQLPEITNNLTEMVAMVRGLQLLPADWIGRVCSDSQVTLGRVFLGWRWRGIPLWLHHEYQAARERLAGWDKISHILLDGHPTKAQLAAGYGKRGHRVSCHNVWCDQACQAAAEQFLRENGHGG